MNGHLEPIFFKQMVYFYPSYDSITWWRHQRIKKYHIAPFLTHPHDITIDGSWMTNANKQTTLNVIENQNTNKQKTVSVARMQNLQ